LNNITDTSFTQYQLGSNITLPSRRKIRSSTASDLQFKTEFNTVDRNISPVIDLSRFSSVLVHNNINNGGLSNNKFFITYYGDGYSQNANVTISAPQESGGIQAAAQAVYNSNTGRLEIIVTNEGSGYTGNVTATIDRSGGATANATVLVANEINGLEGNAEARYITRKVTLASGFESEDLRIYFDAKIPSGTSIKVYCKVAPIANENFDSEIWRQLELSSSGVLSETDFSEYVYKTPNDTVLPSGDRFKVFAVKLALYSNDTTKVPEVRDLRVIALDE